MKSFYLCVTELHTTLKRAHDKHDDQASDLKVIYSQMIKLCKERVEDESLHLTDLTLDSFCEIDDGKGLKTLVLFSLLESNQSYFISQETCVRKLGQLFFELHFG